MSAYQIPSGVNAYRAPLPIRFFELTRYEPDDPTSHKSLCPACDEGVLHMIRDWPDLRLHPQDFCDFCGQRFVYEDIDRVRAERP